MATVVQSTPAGIPELGEVHLSPENRPGVPMELPPRPLAGAHWVQPESQVQTVPVFKRVGLVALTPVFGTDAPPQGFSGAVRRASPTPSRSTTRGTGCCCSWPTASMSSSRASAGCRTGPFAWRR